MSEPKLFPTFKFMELLDQEFTQPVFQVPAGFGKRLAAWMLDCILVSFAGYVIGLIFGTNIFKESWGIISVSYTHLRAHETVLDLVCRLLLEKTNS